MYDRYAFMCVKHVYKRVRVYAEISANQNKIVPQDARACVCVYLCVYIYGKSEPSHSSWEVGGMCVY
jgi:hypothetical protein